LKRLFKKQMSNMKASLKNKKGSKDTSEKNYKLTQVSKWQAENAPAPSDIIWSTFKT